MQFELGEKKGKPYVGFKGAKYFLTGIEYLDDCILYDLSYLGWVYIKAGSLGTFPKKLIPKVINHHCLMHQGPVPDKWKFDPEKCQLEAHFGESVWVFPCPNEEFGFCFINETVESHDKGHSLLSVNYLKKMLLEWPYRMLKHYRQYTHRN